MMRIARSVAESCKRFALTGPYSFFLAVAENYGKLINDYEYICIFDYFLGCLESFCAFHHLFNKF